MSGESAPTNPPVLFDMDGVLLVGPGTHPGVYRAAAHDALGELGVIDPPASTAAVLEATRYDPEMADACADLGVDVDAWWAARERHASRRANARVRSGDRERYPGGRAILEELRTGRRLALVSNNREATVSFVADYCFPGVFDVVVARRPTIDDYGRRKPDPTFIHRALDRLAESNIEPDEDSTPTRGVYVGDRTSDVVAARRAGLEPILIERSYTGSGSEADPDAEPAVRIDSLAELPAAVATVLGEPAPTR